MSSSGAAYHEYGYHDTAECCTASYLLPEIFAFAGEVGPQIRVLDVGCGNGFIAGQFAQKGCQVVGIDLSESGIALARQTYPQARFEVLAADSKVLQHLDEAPFDLVVSTEVVEHLYDPRSYAAGCFAALREGGRFICSTPYHGYAKNLMLALAGHWDKHADPLWDGGHIKLWSRNTLSHLLHEAGFTNLQFRGAGRLPLLWKSMVMTGDKG
jgi:2-polyprenyl-3-methyl-5-hydroxy-6-metoxy-1,4-benzoquinol methylase